MPESPDLASGWPSKVVVGGQVSPTPRPNNDDIIGGHGQPERKREVKEPKAEDARGISSLPAHLDVTRYLLGVSRRKSEWLLTCEGITPHPGTKKNQETTTARCLPPRRSAGPCHTETVEQDDSTGRRDAICYWSFLRLRHFPPRAPKPEMQSVSLRGKGEKGKRKPTVSTPTAS